MENNTQNELDVLQREAVQIPQLLPDFRKLTEFYDSDYFKENLIYDGDDLGLTYGVEGIRLKFWAPVASSVNLLLYQNAQDQEPLFVYPMEKDVKGTYSLSIPALADGLYYLLEVDHQGEKTYTPGPYVTSVSINGEKGCILDLRTTDPEGFRYHDAPKLENPVDAVVYEVHVRDMTIHHDSGVAAKGKYLGFVEEGTKNEKGHATGIDHLKELGVTHVQLLPIFDYNCLDESKDEGQYNWGYDPLNYNVPEGSYSSDAKNPKARITELKSLIMGLHKNGMGVIMDVVYNHTSDSLLSNFHKSTPLYYHRSTDGNFTDASACGNETASERPMMKKFMIDSLLHWVKEYKIDGFRFDLMGIHDIETMLEIETALRKVKPDIILYGEGWTGGASPLPEEKRLVKRNIGMTPGIGAFNDDFRDGVKGHVFFNERGGFVSGGGLEESVKFGITGAVRHKDHNYRDILYTDFPWAQNPGQSINYVSAHDNLTLYDKLVDVNKGKSAETIRDMAKLANAMVLTSQGVPFIHAGAEFLRTKFGDHNSYRSPDSINALHWDMKSRNIDVVNYYKGLISLRKTYKAFRMRTQKEIEENILFYTKERKAPLKLKASNVISYILKDPVEKITFLVAFNGSGQDQQITLPRASWDVLVDKFQAGTDCLWRTEQKKVSLKPHSALVMKTDGLLPLA
ncbi:type I pullulanase [Proteiniclasticum sp. SCR006]|uniref:Type I pullulanase n=1 Tax=Proteiniclasticum aestuarii TaxID=2817862 RepID=A0A939H8V2_9CLOT|nr:type I pullulanase [Proteiniclasticum aestuarii]MBO1264123.1 type I pullulanase [Proteiniclasticum aestuarii]